MALTYFSQGAGVICFILSLWVFLSLYSSVSSSPKGIPLLRKHLKIMPKVFQRMEALFTARKLLKDGYHEYSKNSQPFLLSSFNAPEVMIPTSDIRKILGGRKVGSDAESAHFDMLESDFTFLSPHIRRACHEEVIKGPFSKQLGSFTAMMMDEIANFMDHKLATDQEGDLEIKVFDTVAQVVACTANRVFVGKDIGRDDQFLSNAKKFAMDVVVGSSILALMPKWLKRVLGPIVCVPNALHFHKCAKILSPMIQKRLDIIHEKGQEGEEPNDYLQLHIKHMLKAGDGRETTAKMISLRLMLLNFASIFPTAGVLTNFLLDLSGADPELCYWEGLRADIEKVQQDCGHVWTEESLARLWKVDSALKETMRKWSVLSYGMPRKITSSDGVRLGNGATLHQGTTVGIPMFSIHHDESFYPRPFEYDAFRFSDMREKAAQQVNPKDQPINPNRDQANGLRLSLTATSSESYFAWGSGKHACPGRFMASSMMKLITIYLVTNFDLQPTGIRQPNRWFGSLILPPGSATIRLKRRVVAGNRRVILGT